MLIICPPALTWNDCWKKKGGGWTGSGVLGAVTVRRVAGESSDVSGFAREGGGRGGSVGAPLSSVSILTPSLTPSGMVTWNDMVRSSAPGATCYL